MENTGQTVFGDAPIGAILRFSQWKAGSFDHFSVKNFLQDCICLDVRKYVRYYLVNLDGSETIMTSITATALRQNIYQTIAQVNANCAPISITSSKGKGAVLIGEDEWAAIEETLFLNSIPGMTESLQIGLQESLDDCISEDQLEW
ncbi:type II toxin-antitoxin system Phd/YefM family antitoxin [Adlercreutzia sp. ZJ154]|uniref:type II toxin-antitoxin system Phd/YefM family antitoxin n=1 Tax=Adlercreutzia sp. ZJ154 TaxID=2709790 RepID=UPI001F1511F0|nr:type II toxin-antitoxin system Phd/YefM family antitoxin [Adlercreutzia sp. ZJ154]